MQPDHFLLGIVMMVLLNLAVWTLGAELLFLEKQIKELDDLPNLLSSHLGESKDNAPFYAGIFAAIYTSSSATPPVSPTWGSHAWLRSRPRYRRAHPSATSNGIRSYRWIVIVLPRHTALSGRCRGCPISSRSRWWPIARRWCSCPALPADSGGLPRARATRSRHTGGGAVGNVVMATFLFALAIYFAYQAVRSLVG